VRSTFARSFRYSGDRAGDALTMFDVKNLVNMIQDPSLSVK
jgi:hypothetical protein